MNVAKEPLIRVLLIEDDPMVQEVNRMFVEKLSGFTIVGTTATGEEGMVKTRELQPDLILLDIFMPKQDGLSFIKQIREQYIDVDIIAVTAANDTKTIKTLLRYGVMDYLVKPFTFERLKAALTQYEEMFRKMQKEAELSQDSLDEMIKQKQAQANMDDLPKGLHAHTLQQVIERLEELDEPKSAEEIGRDVGLARVTVRRYLNYLESVGQVEMDLTYGSIGRPIQTYKLKQG
ncbi:response regulator [Halalkalibacterium halodurans]|uniref:response regulator n=1 Tax=Halalkalibacterium halodurans TaxID=86665 RepID=UPI000680CFA6|nr:response regulator [Halalkalibacterium halodurans]MED4080262.1 response regulator [Halalkalibacterium halodurans]MED4103950.1 response regulator [Halalkalibacterium halodurans]MED4122617.1 response regulator [Halalkalibacterium halodurans]MED4172324.1 response regulator [Halalkalibacterium halodurans]MED4188504.1 response regulator [Halalkalibacterium halodurans]